VAVDLKQAAVVIMSHLDRLAAPHTPPANFTKVSYMKWYFCYKIQCVVTRSSIYWDVMQYNLVEVCSCSLEILINFFQAGNVIS
jgi:hypothetical protein